MSTRSYSSIRSAMELLRFVSFLRRPPNVSLGNREPSHSHAIIFSSYQSLRSDFQIQISNKQHLFSTFICSINIDRKLLFVTYFICAVIYLPSQSACTELNENSESTFKSIETPLECSEPWENIMCQAPHSADLLVVFLEKSFLKTAKYCFFIPKV